MKIGILELLCAGPNQGLLQTVYSSIVTKQYVGIMPQAISAWCRNLGHEVFYATYHGQRDPKTLIPNDLDIVFISAYTQASALAYALAKLYRKEKTLTVIGGPHAKQFPEDCLRYFDVVVGDCDETLIKEILADMPQGMFVTSGRPLKNIPGVEQRMPEIRSSSFLKGKPFPFTSIPIITSLGCPNSCDFCIDWNNPYVLLPLEQLAADMRYVFNHFPNVVVGLHDPNFAIKFEQVISVMEKVPNHKRINYIMETSLSTLHGSRLERLKKMGNFYIVPGVESWMAYSNKVGIGSSATPREKLNKVIEQFRSINPYVAGIQANFIFGLDVDRGDEPTELTKEFALKAPFVMPNFNIPVPFGNTPLYEKYRNEDRLLTTMPFTFYYMPYLIFVLKNYDAATFYKKLIDMVSYVSSGKILAKRLQTSRSLFTAGYTFAKTMGNRQMITRLQEILNLLNSDRQFRNFHNHETDKLPEFYHRRYDALLGSYATLMSREERTPVLSPKKIDTAPVAQEAVVINRR